MHLRGPADCGGARHCACRVKGEFVRLHLPLCKRRGVEAIQRLVRGEFTGRPGDGVCIRSPIGHGNICECRPVGGWSQSRPVGGGCDHYVSGACVCEREIAGRERKRGKLRPRRPRPFGRQLARRQLASHGSLQPVRFSGKDFPAPWAGAIWLCRSCPAPYGNGVPGLRGPKASWPRSYGRSIHDRRRQVPWPAWLYTKGDWPAFMQKSVGKPPDNGLQGR